MITLLKDALGIVGKAISSRATLPVLTHVCLSTDNGRLQVKGSNLEQTIVVEMGFRGEEMDICVPYSIFSNYVGQLEQESIHLEQDGISLVLTQGETKAEFSGVPGSEFPLIPSMVKKNALELDVDIARWVLSSVLHAAATDESRPILTGICIQQDDKITFATADGFRLAVTTVEHDSEPFSVIVPANTIQAVLKAMPDEGTVLFDFDKTRICICLPEDNGLQTIIYSQLIEGNFVNYNQIVPERQTPIIVSKEKLVKAIKRAAVFVSREANNVKFSVSDGKMTLNGMASEYGEMEEIIEVDYEGDVEFSLNYAYMLDALSTCGNVVHIECASGDRPLVFSSERDEHLNVLMPMAVR